MSVFETHRAMRNSRTPALHMASTVREVAKNAARRAACMGIPGAGVECTISDLLCRSISLQIVPSTEAGGVFEVQGELIEGLCGIVEGLCSVVEGLCGKVEGLCRT